MGQVVPLSAGTQPPTAFRLLIELAMTMPPAAAKAFILLAYEDGQVSAGAAAQLIRVFRLEAA